LTFWLFEDLSHTSGTQEHAIVLLAVEVSLSFDRAIIFASRLFQLYADPIARLEVYWADMADDCNSAIVELNYLAS
jgi:hypothetical protein